MVGRFEKPLKGIGNQFSGKYNLHTSKLNQENINEILSDIFDHLEYAKRTIN